MSHVRDKAALETRVHRMVNRTVKRLDLGWLEIQVRFDEGNTSEATCSTQCDWYYRRAVMNWVLQEVSHMTDAELQLVTVHELCHALIACAVPETEEKVNKLEELATENVARVIIHLMQNES